MNGCEAPRERASTGCARAASSRSLGLLKACSAFGASVYAAWTKSTWSGNCSAPHLTAGAWLHEKRGDTEKRKSLQSFPSTLRRPLPNAASANQEFKRLPTSSPKFSSPSPHCIRSQRILLSPTSSIGPWLQVQTSYFLIPKNASSARVPSAFQILITS